jgi:hypothetical protein
VWTGEVMAWFPDNKRFIANITPRRMCLNCEHFSAWILLGDRRRAIQTP